MLTLVFHLFREAIHLLENWSQSICLAKSILLLLPCTINVEDFFNLYRSCLLIFCSFRDISLCRKVALRSHWAILSLRKWGTNTYSTGQRELFRKKFSICFLMHCKDKYANVSTYVLPRVILHKCSDIAFQVLEVARVTLSLTILSLLYKHLFRPLLH